MKLINKANFNRKYTTANFMNIDSLYTLMSNGQYYGLPNVLPNDTLTNLSQQQLDNFLDSADSARKNPIWGDIGNLFSNSYEQIKNSQPVQNIGNIANESFSNATQNLPKLPNIDLNSYNPFINNTPASVEGSYERLNPQELLNIKTGLSATDVPYQKLNQQEMLGLTTGDVANTNPALIAGELGAGGLAGVYGINKIRNVIKPKYTPPPDFDYQAYERFRANPQKAVRDSKGFYGFSNGNKSYMACFGFSAKPIPNLTIRKKAVDVFNKKMGKLASSGQLSSTDPLIRKSALQKVTKLKERIRNA